MKSGGGISRELHDSTGQKLGSFDNLPVATRNFHPFDRTGVVRIGIPVSRVGRFSGVRESSQPCPI